MSRINIEMPRTIPNVSILETAVAIDSGGFHSNNERLIVLSPSWSEFCETALLGSEICQRFINEGILRPDLRAIASYAEVRQIVRKVDKSLKAEELLVSAKKAFDGIVSEEVAIEDASNARLLVKAFENRFFWNSQNQTQ